MTISIFSNGKEYISAIRAGELVGYSSDYVGQLCRAQKIPAKLIGRTWYVELEALEEHRRTRQLGKPRGYKNMAKALEELSEEVASVDSLEREGGDLSKAIHTGFKYMEEKREFLPALSKGEKVLVKAKKPTSSFKSFSLASLALMVVVMTGISTMEQVVPSLAYSLDTRVENISEQYVRFNPVGLLGNSLSAFQKGWIGDERLEEPPEIRLTKEEIRFLLMGDSVQ